MVLVGAVSFVLLIRVCERRELLLVRPTAVAARSRVRAALGAGRGA